MRRRGNKRRWASLLRAKSESNFVNVAAAQRARAHRAADDAGLKALKVKFMAARCCQFRFAICQWFEAYCAVIWSGLLCCHSFVVLLFVCFVCFSFLFFFRCAELSFEIHSKWIGLKKNLFL
jgi:hypothetical protein